MVLDGMVKAADLAVSPIRESDEACLGRVRWSRTTPIPVQ